MLNVVLIAIILYIIHCLNLWWCWEGTVSKPISTGVYERGRDGGGGLYGEGGGGGVR